MEEWDPRDVSFITPPCSLHSFCISFPAGLLFPLLPYTAFSSFTLSLHPFIYSLLHTPFSHSDFHIISLHLLVCHQLLNNLPSISSHHLLRRIALLLPLALIFRFHHLLWQQSSFLLSIFSPLSGVHPTFFCFSTPKQRQYPSFPVHFTKGSERKKCGWRDVCL